MLGKLIKHEFIAMARYFLPLYGLTAIFTPFLGLLCRPGLRKPAEDLLGIMSGLSIFGFIFLMFALFIASSILIILRFYRTMATSEAYLTFTLPAKPSEILCSKLLVASIWQILSFFIAFVAIIGILFISGIITPNELAGGISNIITELFHTSYSAKLVPFIVLSCISMLLGVPTGILLYYCSIMLGQLFAEHRVIASFAMYMAISTVMQIISLFVTFPVTMALEEEAASISFLSNMNIVMLLGTIINVLIGAGCYIATIMIMKKKLNVR